MRRRVEIRPGLEMPVIGLGVYEIPEGREVEQAVEWALEAGYRHIDTAQGYGNEAGVGRGLRASGIPREQVFITTKFAPSRSDPEAELERSLERLAVEQVDLYLVHSPRGGPKWAWPGMERALERGLTKSIGVSNFGVSQLGKLVGSCTVRPAVNQVQFNPLPVSPPPGGGLPKPWDRARGLQPVDAGRRSRRSDRRRCRRPGRPDPRPGAAAMGAAA